MYRDRYAAPTGSNRQNWHFVVVTDPEKRDAVASYYRQSFGTYIGAQRIQPAAGADNPQVARRHRVRESAIYLAD